MSGFTIDEKLCTLCGICQQVCPFGAVEQKAQGYTITNDCRACGICKKKCQSGAISIQTATIEQVDLAAWQGIMVYVQRWSSGIHPVAWELIGEARRLCKPLGQKVYAVIVGEEAQSFCQELLCAGVDQVLAYDQAALTHASYDLVAKAMQDAIEVVRPAAVLIGATIEGRSLAPRLATRFLTGLTADCTQLEFHENSELIQIRPAFGGNLMARIKTRTRPQFATVRERVMMPGKATQPNGEVLVRSLPTQELVSPIIVRNTTKKTQGRDITQAETLVVAGRGVRDKRDLALLQSFADVMGGQLAATRPLIEAGWVDPALQIGLSGRSVRPKLLIACGVSGSVQFIAGMSLAEHIVAVNQDEKAPIFSVAHLGLVGDLYEMIPILLKRWGVVA